MEKTRANLSQIFREVLGSNHTYFQPPSGTQIKYPCIIYKLDGIYNDRADDINYRKNKRWQVTVIDKNPDSSIYEQLIDRFDHCSLDRTAVSDNLNHWYLTLFW
jgi:hypothetical protein